MRRLLKALGWTLAVLTVLLALGAGGIEVALAWAKPPRTVRTQVPGLSARVSITLDRDGIPFIRAASETDGAAALGFMHARDRMFQMELMRRAASGRLSEIAGSATLPLDRTMRTLGLRRRAEAEAAALDPDTRAILEAYASGVNAWIALRGRYAAPEFLLLGAPEPWTPADSLLWGKTMALYLSSNWRLELLRARLLQSLPPEKVRLLWPDQPDTPGPSADALPPATMTRLAQIVPDFPAPFTQPQQASNEWAVDGQNSSSGAPLLAGDPHLAYGAPGIWYLARVDTPSGVLAGATAPGVPFMVLGHNGRIAWTFTTTGADTQDVFIETPLPDGQYATPDGPKPFITRDERIRVRGQPDDILHVRETRHGPVLSDLDDPNGPVLAVAMASLAPSDTAATGLLALNRAGSVAEAGIAAGAISAPVQNLLVADRNGIGQFTTGRIPLRRAGDGSVPVQGADGQHDWIGFASGDALPRIVNPPSGRLVNANERVAGPDFPVLMGVDWFGDWRARRIRALLAQRKKHDTASFAAMQIDVRSTFAEQILPALLATKPADDASAQVLAALRGWDGSMGVMESQPVIFQSWVDHLEAELLRRIGVAGVGLGARDDIVGRALSPQGRDAWCDGDCGPALSAALTATVADLPGWAGLRWGAEHKAIFAHPLLGRLPLLADLTTWSIEQPGDSSTVFVGASRGRGFDAIHGPSFRGVYDLADLDRSLFIAAPGQSGNPTLPQASSMLARWRDGGTLMLGRQPGSIADTVGLLP